MQVVKKYPNNVFSWVDLATTDPDGAKAFYSGLFGWEFEDLPTGMGGVYTLCKLEGYNVAGLSAMQPDMQAQGVPPYWSSYVNHEDADAIAAKITEAGGNVLFPPMDVMDTGRMTMGSDPTGAMFGVWQPASHIGAQLVNVPNALTWNELQTSDVEAAKGFYGAVFGWETETDNAGYVVLKADGRMHGGMMAILPEWGPVPSNWAVYFLTEDVPAAVAKVSELGGKVMVQPAPAGQIGELSVVQDPQGGTFSVISYAGEASPPPGY